MPNTISEHLKYLDHQVAFAPYGSDDEYEAAQYISEVFKSRGFEPQMQEFAVPAQLDVVRSACMVAVFLGAILSGIGSLVVRLIGLALLVAGSGLLICDYLQKPFLSKLSPDAGSQNVIAKHTGQGKLAGRGTRPIVVVAHYDTPHESLMVRQGLTKFIPLLKMGSYYAAIAVLLLSIIKLPLPSSVYNIFWVIAIVIGLLPLLQAVVTLVDHYGVYTDGANNNKASLAALFRLIDTISNGGDSSLYERMAEEIQDNPTEQIVFDEGSLEDESLEDPVAEIFGVRHGLDTIKQFGILPADCEIVETDIDASLNSCVYESSEQSSAVYITEDQYEEEHPQVEDSNAAYSEISDMSHVSSLDTPETNNTTNSESQQEIVEDLESELDNTNPLEPINRLSFDQTPDDDSWGKTNFKPEQLGRRSQLFDLPDPGKKEVDPFIDNDTVAVEQPTVVTSIQEDLKVIKPQYDESEEPRHKENKILSALSRTSERAKSKTHQLFSKKRHQEDDKMTDFLGLNEDYDAKKDGNEISSWDNFDDDNWKGGATTTPQFVVLDGAQASADVDSAPTKEDLRDAIMDMASDLQDADSQEQKPEMIDEKLLCHDIWFVAAGSSEAGHAGMKAFLQEYKRDLRGAFLINLDAIGLGDLTLLTEEGFFNRRRSDRRLGRIVKTTAKELGFSLNEASYGWSETDATPAMRKSVRSVTLMGMSDGLPALWGSADDVIEEVETDQIIEAVHLVEEVIRRS